MSEGVVLMGLGQVRPQVHRSSPVDLCGLRHGSHVLLVLAVEDEPDWRLGDEDQYEDPGAAEDCDAQLEVLPVWEEPGQETACRRQPY